MSRFTRSTYRVARRRAIGRLLDAHDAYDYAIRKYGHTHPVTIDALAEDIIREWEARQIVARGRREGVWQ